MDQFVIRGGKKLKGTVKISGAKNSVLPILAAALLSEERSVVENVPDLRDVATMCRLLQALGAKVNYGDGRIEIIPGKNIKPVAPYHLVSKMRASVCVLGPLVAREGKAQVSLPGGCVIGARPIDLHLKGLQALGARIKIEHGYVYADVKDSLRGAEVYLGGHYGSSVLATANVMMAAALANGTTFIENAACEPEVVDLADFLNKMGARVQGHGSHLIKIDGVRKLRGATHEVIPDRIETGTFMIAAAITGGDITIKHCNPDHNKALIDKLTQAGVLVERKKDGVRVRRSGKLMPIEVATLTYPGFPTDLQAQLMALMSVTPGISVITEKIYPDRFIHVSELNRMGTHIFVEGSSAVVNGVKRLSGAPVMASDLRASAALILAGLAADGETNVHRVYHLDRGYEKIEEKLSALGAEVYREKDTES